MICFFTPLQLDHNLTAQLWDDPLFWEHVPWAEPYREEAEEMLARVVARQSSLSLRKTSLYNRWHAELLHRAQTDFDSVQPVVEFIHRKRQRKDPIWLRGPAGPVFLWGDYA